MPQCGEYLSLGLILGKQFMLEAKKAMFSWSDPTRPTLEFPFDELRKLTVSYFLSICFFCVDATLLQISDDSAAEFHLIVMHPKKIDRSPYLLKHMDLTQGMPLDVSTSQVKQGLLQRGRRAEC